MSNINKEFNIKNKQSFHKAYIITLLIVLLLLICGIFFYISNSYKKEPVKAANTSKENIEFSEKVSVNNTVNNTVNNQADDEIIWLLHSYKVYSFNGSVMALVNETINSWERYNSREDAKFTMHTENKQYNMKTVSTAERKGSISKITEIMYKYGEEEYRNTVTSTMYKNTDIPLYVSSDEDGYESIIMDLIVEKESKNNNNIVLNVKDNMTGEMQDYIIYPDNKVVKTVYGSDGDRIETTMTDYYYNNGAVTKLIDIKRYSGDKKISDYYMKVADVTKLSENIAIIIVEQYGAAGGNKAVKNSEMEYIMKKYKRENGKLTLYEE